LATANRITAEKAAKTADLWIKVKAAEVDRALASERFRQKELKRFEGLASGPNRAVTDDIVDERREYWEAAVAGSAAARFAVDDAKAELEKANAKLEAAKADEKVADSLVGVAKKDQDKAQALLNFATIRAPFDGIVTSRKVDPGHFVQNAATAHTEPLLTVVRDDIVTVYMKVPDKFAFFVTTNTDAVIQMDTLPGVVIRAKVTRYSGSLDTPQHDRTMRVEVDLYNRGATQYKEDLEREKTSSKGDLKTKTLPFFPQVVGKDIQENGLRLMPGQYGSMRLVLKSFGNAYLLPHNAVVSQGGASYVFVVKKGVAVKVPVDVQADNGEEVKVALIEKARGQEVKRDLTGEEEIVITNQGELGYGQAIKTTRVDW
jgi:multidrug efflux pump subunit AcrA (membrane-fusion protein)